MVTIIGGLVGILSQPVLANLIQSIQEIIPTNSAYIRLGFFLFFLFLAPLALYIAYLVSKIISVIYQFAKFGAVGALNSFVDLGVFNLATFLYGVIPSTGLFAVFKAISFLSATTNSFFWNKKWTFDSRGKSGASQVAKFYTIAIIGGFLNVGVATFVKTLAPSGVPENIWVNLISPIAGIFSALFWNFIGYKFLVFKKEDGVDVSRV